MAVKHFFAGFALGGIAGILAGRLLAKGSGDQLLADFAQTAESGAHVVKHATQAAQKKAIETASNAELGIQRAKEKVLQAKDDISRKTYGIRTRLIDVAERVGHTAGKVKEVLSNIPDKIPGSEEKSNEQQSGTSDEFKEAG